MVTDLGNSRSDSKLRRRAEIKIASHQAISDASPGEVDAKRLLHELLVHHEELEMQNEELQKTKRELKIVNNTLEEQVENRTKELSKVIAKLQDEISNREQVEENNRILQQQFQQAQKLESLGVLAGGIAHDFNNILAVIISSCALAQVRPQMVGTLLPEIETAAQRAADLCRQMLAYAGKSLMIMKQVKLAALVDDIIRMLRATINKNVMIIADLSEDLPAIKGDTSQLRQIVLNLLINAAEAIGEVQGEIRATLAITTVADRQSELDHLGRIIPAGRYVRLTVTDNGCGMDDETRRRIFEPFYTTKFTGRGLGMSAVLGIITAHKGALQLISQPSQGTTFTVYLPVQNDDSSADEKVQQAALPWKGSGTLLLVEDEPQLRMVAKELILDLGFFVIEAANGREALEQYQQNSADITLVLTDIGMPVMDGYTLFRELKNINPTLPIIVTSGFGDTVVTDRMPREEISGLISKPYNYDQLLNVLKGVVEGIK